jgi:hypothetical protein
VISLQQRLVKSGRRLERHARCILLAAAGRESPEATSVRSYAPADLGIACARRLMHSEYTNLPGEGSARGGEKCFGTFQLDGHEHERAW